MIANPDGQLPDTPKHGLGLYYRDCRFLKTYELRLDGEPPVPLGTDVAAGDHGVVQLTNAELHGRRNALPRDTLDIEWNRSLDPEALALIDLFTLQNWGHDTVEFTLEFRFAARFEDVFDVRGLLEERLGRGDPPEWQRGLLRFVYHGKDKLARSLTILLPPKFTRSGSTSASSRIRLEPRERRALAVQLVVRESARQADVRPGRRTLARFGQRDPARQVPTGWPRENPYRSDSTVLDRVLARGFTDLRVLRSNLRNRSFIAAGLPWFATLFGRDSLIAALQLLPFAPDIARDTLRLLAAYQADRVDQWRDAEPGKILHELRVGELARTGAIPHSPYYGSVDATPLFLLVLAWCVEWTGDLALFDELEDNVRRALDWIDHYGDSDGDGYVEYRSASKHGLINQGWKDSGDAIVDQDGTIATPPIALIEVQAYVYAAKGAIAHLFELRGQGPIAERLRREADELRQRFERDFWVESLGCYAMALEAEKQPLRVVSSNAGHALWGGIADSSRAGRVADRLMADDMFSGWGVRTLSEQCRAYSPIGYHLGTVWPHDNAVVAAGLKRYGFAAHARRIFDGITAAAMHFEHHRLPELWTGFSRQKYQRPIRYPIACHPQAWAAGSLPFLLQHLLGLEAQGLERRLRVVRPILPGLAGWLEVRGLQVGDASVDLRFASGADREDAVRVEVIGLRGELDVHIQHGPRLLKHTGARAG